MDQDFSMKVAIIGAGLIGNKRSHSLPPDVKLVVVCDVDKERASQLASQFGADTSNNWREVVADPRINAVIISTTNNCLAPIAQLAISQGKHVLIEKPGSRNLDDFKKISIAWKKSPVVVMFGYNHRYHPSVIKAKEIIDSKELGPVLFIRARYGHGARIGYEKEWRFNPYISGGGELLDQGSHLIDLTNYFIGPMAKAQGITKNLFWPARLEDSAFFILSNKLNQIAHLSATCVEWKNIFVFEIMLKKAKLQINGLGRSYGPETLTIYKMKPEMGPPDVEEHDLTENEDLSWQRESEEFFRRIKSKDYSDKNLEDAKHVLSIINTIYKQNKSKK